MEYHCHEILVAYQPHHLFKREPVEVSIYFYGHQSFLIQLIVFQQSIEIICELFHYSGLYVALVCARILFYEVCLELVEVEALVIDVIFVV